MSKQETFESALKRLEQIVEELEGGDIPLDKSIEVFEEGNKLIKFCLSKLEAAEGRIKKLIKQAENEFKTEDF